MTSLSPSSPDTPSFRKLFVVEAKPETQQTAHSKRNPAGRTLKDSSLTLRATGESASLKMRADKISHPITKSEFFC